MTCPPGPIPPYTVQSGPITPSSNSSAHPTHGVGDSPVELEPVPDSLPEEELGSNEVEARLVLPVSTTRSPVEELALALVEASVVETSPVVAPSPDEVPGNTSTHTPPSPPPE